MSNPKIQLRHDTSSNWSSVNPILLEGEFAYETDTNKIKIGNGSDNYNNLSYYGGEGGIEYTAGDGIVINGTQIGINTSSNNYGLTIPDTSNGTKFQGNLLIQPNNITPISQPAGRCGCANIPIDMDNFTEIEYVCKFTPTNINNADCRYVELFTDTDHKARFWVDSYGGNLRFIVFGSDNDNIKINNHTTLTLNQEYWVRYLITPTSVTCYYKKSKGGSWIQVQNYSGPVNSTTFSYDNTSYPYTFYVGGVNAGTTNPGTSAAAAIYDLSETFVRVNETTYPMLTSYNRAIANLTNVGLVKPDGNTITIDEEGTISSISSTPDNLVTLDTQQTISGEKTFSSSIHINNDIVTEDGHKIANGSQAGVVAIGDSNASLALYSNDNVTINSDTIYTDGMNDELCHLAMPDPTKNVTLSFSGTQQDYTVPSDGYFMVNGQPTTSGGQLWITCTGNGLSSQLTGNATIWVAGYIPCKKNSVVRVNAAGFTIANIRFTPCVGSTIEEG